MKMFQSRFALLVVALVCSLAVMAGDKKPVKQRIYMFGFAASFTDSVACQTTVQQLDSAWLDEHKFLMDRALYSLQLQYHMEHVQQVKNPVCTVFFGRSAKRVQRLWNKMQRRYQKEEGLSYRILPEDGFKFVVEEWTDPYETQQTQ